MRLAAIFALPLALAACGPNAPAAPDAKQAAQVPAAPPPAAAKPAPAEPLDPFVVMVDAERWTVIIDKALDGAREAQSPTTGVDLGDLFRADSALKRGAASVIELRNAVCGQGLLTGAACNLPEWPAWTREPPTEKTPIEEIDRRSQWLSGVISPFTEAGCEAGKKATKDDMFCSVE